MLTFEDLHWADKTTEECITFLLDHIAGARVLLLCTHRPEFVSTWSRKSYHSTLTLTRLSRRECHDMLMALLGSADIHESLVELIIEKSEGVPFFLEELVQTLRETGAIVKRDGQWQLTTDATTVQVPATIHDVLMARIDRLPDGAKRVLQIGSVIGRDFSWELLRAVAELPEQDLHTHLAALSDAELVYERGVTPHASYVFKHALTQDVAYDSLLLAAKRLMQQQLGDAFLAQHRDDLEEWCGILAHHFAYSADPTQALPYLMQAGERAQRVYANAEAVRAFAQALAILQTVPQTEAVRRQQADLTV